MPASAPRSITCVSRGRSTGASFEAMSTSARSPVDPARRVVRLADPRAERHRGVGLPERPAAARRARQPLEDRLLERAEQRGAGGLAVGQREVGERGARARGVRQPLHPLELLRPRGVDDRGGDDLVRGVQPEELHAEAAQHVGGEVPRPGDADRARARQQLDERHVVDVLVARAAACRPAGRSGRCRAGPLDSWIVLRLRARPTPSRSARKFQCSGRRVQSSGPSRIACSYTVATAGASACRRSRSTTVSRARRVLEVLDLGLERLDLEAQLLALLRALADEVAEHHQRRRGRR